EVCDESQLAVSPAVRAKALYAARWLATWQHDPVQATPLLEDSLKLYRSLEDTQGTMAVLTCLNALRRNRDDGETSAAQSKEGTRDTRKRGELGEFAESEVREGKEADTRPAFRSERPSPSPMRLTAQPAPFMYEALTAREGEVLQLLAMGISNSQIAERRVVSRHTRHVTYKLAYDFVGGPKYRKHILTGKIAAFVEQELCWICKATTWTIGALNVQEDHVHLFRSSPHRLLPRRLGIP